MIPVHLSCDDGFSCQARVEDLPERVAVVRHGDPRGSFWGELVVAISQGDLARLADGDGNALRPFVLEGRKLRWRINDAVAFGHEPSPLGSLTAVVFRFEDCEAA